MAQTFGAWLKRQAHRDDFIGDLAQDFLTACKWRDSDPSALDEAGIRYQMACLGACTKAYTALDDAVVEWKASR